MGPLFTCIKAAIGKLIQEEMPGSCRFDFSNLAVSGILVIIDTVIYLCAKYHDKHFKLYLI